MAEVITEARQHGVADVKRQLGLTACIYVSLMAGLFVTTPVFAPRTWVIWVGLFIAIIAAGTTLIRVTTRNDAFVTLAALGLGTIGLVTCFGSESGSWSFPFLPSSWTGLANNYRVAGEYLSNQPPPVEMTPQTLLFLATVALALYVVMDALAIGLNLPFLGVTLALAAWIPAIALGHNVAVWPVVVVLIATLVAAQVRTWSPHAPSLLLRRGALTGAAVVIGLVLAPTVPYVQLFTISGDGTGPGGSGSGGQQGVMRLSDDLDLTAHLGERSAEPMLRYRPPENVRVDRIRLFTADTFHGQRWTASQGRQGFVTPLTGNEYLWQPQDFLPAGDPVEVSATIAGLRTNNLPIPVSPTSAQAAGQWHVDLDNGVITSQSGDMAEDTEFSFTVYPDALTYEVLNQATGSPADELAMYLELPDDAYRDLLHAYAVDVTEGASTQLEQAVALQEHFRTDPRFRYSFTVGTPITSNAVFDFLADGQGYCVQFSSAMATLARTLGIPARIGVGFLPGTRLASAEFLVRGEDAHAWPELYFEGVGWVAFEPTPSIQTGSAPPWTAPSPATPTPEPTDTPTQTATPTPTAPTQTATTSASTAPGAGSSPSIPAYVLWLIGIALLGVGTWMAFVLIRRHRYGPIKASTPEDGYDHLQTRLSRIGVTWPEHTPVGQVPDAVIAALAARSDDAEKARAELTKVAEDLDEWSSLTQHHWYSDHDVEIGTVVAAANRAWLGILEWRKK